MDVEIAVSSRHPREASLFLKYSTLVNAQVPSTMKYPTLVQQLIYRSHIIVKQYRSSRKSSSWKNSEVVAMLSSTLV